MTSIAAGLAVVRVETTVRSTYEREAGARKRAVAFKADREIDSPDTWMFTDGGSKGWQSLVVLRPGQDPRLVASEARTETRNVGAEVAGLVSALAAVLPGERVAIVSDFLWSIYYVLGWYQVENALLREQVGAARALLAERRPASVRFIPRQGARARRQRARPLERRRRPPVRARRRRRRDGAGFGVRPGEEPVEIVRAARACAWLGHGAFDGDAVERPAGVR
jgi:hypothetical protein